MAPVAITNLRRFELNLRGMIGGESERKEKSEEEEEAWSSMSGLKDCLFSMMLMATGQVSALPP